MILAIALSAVLAVILNAGTVIVFFKPEGLRLAELPVLLWVKLARDGRARRRLRDVLAARNEEAAARRLAAVRAMVEADVRRNQRVRAAAAVMRHDLPSGIRGELPGLEGRGPVCLDCDSLTPRLPR